MIGILDPALLLPHDEAAIEQELATIALVCRHHNVRLVAIPQYWPRLWSSLGRSLETQLSPEARRALQAVRRLGQPPGPHQQVPISVWRRGFRQLFNGAALGFDWEDAMAAAVAAAFRIDNQVIVFTRRILGRNLRTHTAGHTTLDENTRWVLYVSMEGIGPQQVLCVYHRRNLVEGWTARYDWRLPSIADGARYPFCPIAQWWKGSATVFGTVQSKPVWLDAHGNGWARPDIPGGAGYHWDVFIRSPAHRNQIGVGHINVVQFGAPQYEGLCGDLHHVPPAQQGRVLDVGWTC